MEREDCNCLLPPPKFEVPPPPKPFGLLSCFEDMELVHEDELCPNLHSAQQEKAVTVPEDVSNNKPLFLLVTIAICLLMLLIFGAILFLWCRKNNQRWRNFTKSANPHAKSNGAKKSLVTAEVELDQNSIFKFGSNKCDVPENRDDRRLSSFIDVNNPIYEEISLSKLSNGSPKVRYSGVCSNQKEKRTLLHSEPRKVTLVGKEGLSPSLVTHDRLLYR